MQYIKKKEEEQRTHWLQLEKEIAKFDSNFFKQMCLIFSVSSSFLTRPGGSPIKIVSTVRMKLVAVETSKRLDKKFVAIFQKDDGAHTHR